MKNPQLASWIRDHVPKNSRPLLRGIYFTSIGALGPRFAYWRLRKQTRHPITYSDKVLRKMAYDRNPNLTLTSDRIKVRDYVEKTIGSKYLTDVYAITYNPASIDWAGLPREYVAKVNHGCAGMIFVHEGADPSVSLPTKKDFPTWVRLHIHPDQADPVKMTNLLNHWLSLDYSWDKKHFPPEWAYRDVKRGVIIEERMKVEGGGFPNDIKFYIVHGVTQAIYMATGRQENDLRGNLLDRDWNVVQARLRTVGDTPRRDANPPLQPPPNSDEMLRVAEKLSEITDSVRVDMYAIGERLIFGEMTNYPSGGLTNFEPEEFEVEVGAKWHQTY